MYLYVLFYVDDKPASRFLTDQLRTHHKTETSVVINEIYNCKKTNEEFQPQETLWSFPQYILSVIRERKL